MSSMRVFTTGAAASARQPTLFALQLAAAVAVLRWPLAAASDIAVASPSAVVTIPLDKQYVPVVRNGVTVAHKTAYFGQVLLGAPQPQTFSVVFDTGSGHLFLPAAECSSATCAQHRRYNRSASVSAEDINNDGEPVRGDEDRDEVSVVYGTGEILGTFVREQVCLSGSTSDGGCTKVRVVLASEMSDEPFGSFRFDGVVGLGLESLALDPEFSFLGQLGRSGSLAQERFGYFLSQSDSVPSEISFGGHDARRVSSDLQWEPVHRPELGYWQVKIRSISVGGQPLEVCADGSCTAIADTGTSLLGVPKEAMRKMHVQLARKVPGDPERLDCRHFEGPQIVVELSSGLQLSLGPEDYSRPTAMRVTQNSTGRTQVVCRASLMPVDPDTALGAKAWILGEPVLRKYYTAYDWGARQIGFAPARQPAEDGTSAHIEDTTFFAAHEPMVVVDVAAATQRPRSESTPTNEAPTPAQVLI